MSKLWRTIDAFVRVFETRESKEAQVRKNVGDAELIRDWVDALNAWKLKLALEHYISLPDIDAELLSAVSTFLARRVVDYFSKEMETNLDLEIYYDKYFFDSWWLKLRPEKEQIAMSRILLQGLAEGENLRRLICNEHNLAYVPYDREKREIPIPESPLV